MEQGEPKSARRKLRPEEIDVDTVRVEELDGVAGGQGENLNVNCMSCSCTCLCHPEL
jgi:hypothetical protein